MKKKYLKSSYEYILLYCMIKFIRLFPYNVAKQILISLFITVGMGLGIRKKVALEQLHYTFPEKKPAEIRSIARRMYRHYAVAALELFVPQDIKSYELTIDGWDNIVNSLKLGRGLMLVSGHIGNWELAGSLIAQKNIPISVVIKRLRNNFVNDYINRLRERAGIRIIYKNKALKPTLKSFKQNEAVVSLIDQDAGKDGFRIPFLGKDASVFTGFVRLAQKYDTPLVFGVALRNNDGSYQFIFEEPIIPSEYKVDPASVFKNNRDLAIAAHFHKRVEHYVREYPEQWFWLHKRWKGADKAKVIPDS